MTVLRRVALFSSLSIALAACADPHAKALREDHPAPADAPAALGLAHEAYLAGDFVEMSERLRDVIVDPSSGELALDNAYALLEAAYDATHGDIPARTPLPAFVTPMTFGVLNGGTPFGAHRLIFLDVHLPEGRAAHLRDVRVTKLPNETLLALADGVGTMKVTHQPSIDHVKLERRGLETLPDRGAFAIQITFDDGPGVDTFFLASKLVASAAPEIISPEVGQALADPRPEIAWLPYRSPELAEWDHRSVHIEVTRDSTKELSWNFDKYGPADLGRVRAGEGAGLDPDGYWLSVFCQEQRNFGGIIVSRATETARPFTIVRQN